MYKITISKDGEEINSFESNEFFISALEPGGKRAAVIAQCGIGYIMQTLEAILKGMDDCEVMTNEELSRTQDIFSPELARRAKLRVMVTKDKEE